LNRGSIEWKLVVIDRFILGRGREFEPPADFQIEGDRGIEKGPKSELTRKLREQLLEK
jgi:hypothetical protein